MPDLFAHQVHRMAGDMTRFLAHRRPRKGTGGGSDLSMITIAGDRDQRAAQFSKTVPGASRGFLGRARSASKATNQYS